MRIDLEGTQRDTGQDMMADSAPLCTDVSVVPLNREVCCSEAVRAIMRKKLGGLASACERKELPVEEIA